MSGARHWEQDKEATVYIGNLDERVSDGLVWELMLQAGRIVNVHLPKDRVTQTHQGYGFVEFISEEDADYAAKIMNQVRLYGKPIRVNKASADKQKSVEVGAELFIGNLDSMVDEKMLYDTFGRFGAVMGVPKIARDEANLSKGYGFVSFSDFEASDEAIKNMNGAFLMNKEISVQYAYKKDGKGERHGDEAERMLATQARKHNVQLPIQPLPPQLFAQQQIAPPPPPPPTMNGPMNGPPMNGDGRGMVQNAPPNNPPAGFAAPPNFQNGPPVPPSQLPPPAHHQQLQQHHHHHHQQRTLAPQNPLPPPPSGLPARPPPSLAGYGGPAGFVPPGYGGPPPPHGGSFPPGAPPPSMSQPPASFPPGFAPPAGPPVPGAPGAPAPPPPSLSPSLPPGFQQPYG